VCAGWAACVLAYSYSLDQNAAELAGQSPGPFGEPEPLAAVAEMGGFATTEIIQALHVISVS
jgi:hypothetical protein